MYETMAGVRMVHVPYKGIAPAMTDLMGGEVQLMFGTIVALVPHIQAGKLRALAVTSRKRSALLPDVPTLAESGLPDYQAGSWYGIEAPAGTPREIIDRTERRDRQGAEAARGREAPRRRRRGGHRQHAGGIRRAYKSRARARRQGGARRRHQRRMTQSPTRGVAEFVAGLRYEQIPAEVRERLKLLILDSLGCALYGAELEWCRMLRVMLAGVDSTAACAFGAPREHLSAPHAALANGTQVQSFELDDVHRAGVLHVGAVVLPALVAIAELRPQMSGRRVPRRRRGGLRSRPARRPVHGAGAHRPGLAFGRHRRRVCRRRGRGARA